MSKKTKKKEKPRKPKASGKHAKPAKKVVKPAKAPASKKPSVPPPPKPALPPTGRPIVSNQPPKAPPAARRKAAADGASGPLKPPVVRVKHAIFGIGKLVREMPEGKIEVLFEKVGRKTLLASFVEVLPPVLGG